MAMNTAQQNLQNEWSIYVLAQKEVGFPIFLVLRLLIYNVSPAGSAATQIKLLKPPARSVELQIYRSSLTKSTFVYTFPRCLPRNLI